MSSETFNWTRADTEGPRTAFLHWPAPCCVAPRRVAALSGYAASQANLSLERDFLSGSSEVRASVGSFKKYIYIYTYILRSLGREVAVKPWGDTCAISGEFAQRPDTSAFPE